MNNNPTPDFLILLLIVIWILMFALFWKEWLLLYCLFLIIINIDKY